MYNALPRRDRLHGGCHREQRRLLDVARHELVDSWVGYTGPSAGIAEVNPMMGTRGVRDFLVNADLGVALSAADLAAHADFLSIGSNDLTQFTLAVSRDDAEAGFLSSYVRDQVITANPFEHLDRDGVGRLLRICIDEARGRSPDIPIGLCGEHASDPASVDYLVSLGLDSLSCSPRQVPLTRFSAGRAALTRPTVSPG